MGEVRVVSYDPEWRQCFEAERALLAQVLAPWLEGGIHHVGSTAIPGLMAKPIIDIIAGIRDLQAAHAAGNPLGQLSYVPDPHRPGIAHHFEKPALSVGKPAYGLHLTEPGSDLWMERLAFRDTLRKDPQLLAEYQELKVRLGREHPDDIAGYTAGKRRFVTRVLALSGLEPGRR